MPRWRKRNNMLAAATSTVTPGTPTAKRKKMTKKKKNRQESNGIEDLILSDLVIRTNNSSVPLEEKLVDYVQKNVEEMFPEIGKKTYRVPDVYLNKEGSKPSKDKQGLLVIGQEVMKEYHCPGSTDSKSDRAHSLCCHVIYGLSLFSSETGIPPLFILTSYEYDNFLSRLKAAFKYKSNELEEAKIKFPQGSGVDRGEVDIILFAPGHVVFIQVKAVGDNFDQLTDTENTAKKSINKALKQLDRDEKVFKHVFNDLDISNLQLTYIAALPNLDRATINNSIQEEEKRKHYKFLCKDDLPIDQNALTLSHASKWWKENVFREPVNKDLEKKLMNDLKIIVGRYVGLLSMVTVSSNSSLGLHRMEIRRKGQSVLYVGQRFSEIVLTKTQREYIENNAKLGYLCGPPGSGKTVVLSIRARRWIMHEGNYVVVVNMYRGAPGRAIGKKIYKSIVATNQEAMQKQLSEHCLEIGLNVDKFDREQFKKKVTEKWGDIGAGGEKIMFLVDETYVEHYWCQVFTALREDFRESSLWCAGLYGELPKGFYSMKLSKVIRCPPRIQHVLSLIDWNPKRNECYIKDSTIASLPSDGPLVLTIRHQKHADFSSLPPSKCRMCGEHLLYLLRDQLNVQKSGQIHNPFDLREYTLKCHDVLFLVNMPRSLYEQDRKGFLDTTKRKYKSYMKSLEGCTMLKVLEDAGYPTIVHRRLNCPDLVSDTPIEVINVTWIYTYQGLENTIIVFLPGDEGVSDSDNLSSDISDPGKNIPCPGLQGDSGSECNTSSEDTDSEAADDSLGHETPSITSNLFVPQSPSDAKMFIFEDADVKRYSRWDKNNLFISASRCTSQLILLTR